MDRELNLEKRESVLKTLKDLGYHILKEDKQKNGIWYRLIKEGDYISISLWMDNDGYYRFEFEDWG